MIKAISLFMVLGLATVPSLLHARPLTGCEENGRLHVTSHSLEQLRALKDAPISKEGLFDLLNSSLPTSLALTGWTLDKNGQKAAGDLQVDKSDDRPDEAWIHLQIHGPTGRDFLGFRVFNIYPFNVRLRIRSSSENEASENPHFTIIRSVWNEEARSFEAVLDRDEADQWYDRHPRFQKITLQFGEDGKISSMRIAGGKRLLFEKWWRGETLYFGPRVISTAPVWMEGDPIFTEVEAP